MPFAGIAFIWFVVALRMWVEGTARHVNILLSNIQLVSGILYVALFFAAAASTSVLAASVEFSDGDIDPVVAHQFPQFGNTLVLVFALRMAAMFVMTTSTIGRTSRVVPGWFAWSGYVVAAFLLLERVVADVAGARVPDLAARAERHPAPARPKDPRRVDGADTGRTNAADHPAAPARRAIAVLALSTKDQTGTVSCTPRPLATSPEVVASWRAPPSSLNTLSVASDVCAMFLTLCS